MNQSKNTGEPIALFDIPALHAPIQQELEQAVLRIIKNCRFVLGEEGAALEQEFADTIGTTHAIGTASGTSALHLALLALNIQPGDEVLTSPFTFIGTTIGIIAAGARPVFADIDPQTYTLDPDQAAERITSRTKVLLPVHLYGYAADMDGLMQLAQQKNLRVVEDCAQAHLTEYKKKKVGSIGDIGCFSFYVSKNLGAGGDAGACVTNDAGLDRTLRILRNNGSDPKSRYKHILQGYNARLDEIQAAMLRIKLKHLASWTEARRRLADIYRQALADTPVALPPADGHDSTHTYHLFVIRTPKRDALREHLTQHNIASGVYYPIPLHLQPAYQELGYRKGDFPHAEKAANETLVLPISPEIAPERIHRVAETVRGYFGS